MKALAQNGDGSMRTRAPPPTAPPRIAASASATSGALTSVSASTKSTYSPVHARAPALRVPAIWRFSTRTTRALACSATAAVASLEASSATTISYGSPVACAAAWMAASVGPR